MQAQPKNTIWPNCPPFAGDPIRKSAAIVDSAYAIRSEASTENSVSELRAISRNISLGGVLLEADSALPQHCDVSFIVTVRGHHIIGPTQIVGEGEVVRVEPQRSGAGFAIAVKCKRPISELQGFLPAFVANTEPPETRN